MKKVLRCILDSAKGSFSKCQKATRQKMISFLSCRKTKGLDHFLFLHFLLLLHYFWCNIFLPLLILVYFSLLFFISYILKFSIMISSCLAQCDWVLLSLDIILAHLWWPNHQILLNLFCNTMTKIEILQQFHFFNTTFFVNKTKSWQMLKKFFYRIRYFIKSMLGKLSELTIFFIKKVLFNIRFCLLNQSYTSRDM